MSAWMNLDRGGKDMDTIAIRENSIRINNQKINGVQTIKIKSTAEKGYAEVYIKLLAKLV